MGARKTNGFTLIEVLVVVLIISVLVALLIPAVLGARESARRNQCMNNQREIVVALKQYETEAGQWPGWINTVGETNALSWAAVLLPYLGHNDVWTTVRTVGGVQLNLTSLDQLNIPRAIPRFRCPDVQAEQDFALNYAVNCGFYDGALSATSPTQGGIFFNHDRAPDYDRYQSEVTMSEEIPDGAQNTLAFSENVLASQWFTLGTTQGSAPLAVPTVKVGENYERRPWVIDFSVLWTASAPQCQFINGCLDDGTTFPWSTAANAGNEESDYVKAFRQYCRPSSYHPGGVVVTFCDGHQSFVSDTIEHGAYLRMLNPDG